MFKDVEKALFDLRAGKLIIVVDDDDREAEGDLVGLAAVSYTHLTLPTTSRV